MIDSEFKVGFTECRDLLSRRVAEKAPSKIQMLSGPRQVGKTTLLLALAKKWGERSVYAAGDGAEVAWPGFWERLWARAESTAKDRGKAIVLIDEANTIHDWAGRLKAEWDRIRRLRLPIQIVVTGSSALDLGAGSRESLAGRFERIVLTHWTASALVREFKVRPPAAAEMTVRMGTYPGAFPFRADLPRWQAYVRESILEPAIGRDMLALSPVRKPALLRQVFGVCVSSPAQIVSLQKIVGQMHDRGAMETVASYLALLEQAFLVAAVPKHSATFARRRAAPPKLITLNNALLAAVDPLGIPGRGEDPRRFGVWLENACLAFAWNAGQRVEYWREEPFEVDAVVDGSWGSWAIEVKSGVVRASDFAGLFEFTRRFPKYRPLVVSGPDAEAAVRRLGLDFISWQNFLLTGPPSV